MGLAALGTGTLNYFDGTEWVSLGGAPLPTVTVTGEASDTVVDVSGTDYRVVVWESSGDLVVSGSTLTGVEYLLVGGGGGGGNSGTFDGGAGGGAGGGVLAGTALSLPVGTTPVTVGAGGAGSTSRAALPANGGPSLLGDIYSLGGGGGACAASTGENNDTRRGGTGAAGGGGVRLRRSFGSGVSGFGANGGANETLPFPGGGGGGGGVSGTVGGNGSAASGGDGGNGTASTITGTSVSYGGGGGGSARSTASTPGAGGSGGGGSGGSDLAGGSGVNGTDGLGGGGGGSCGANLSPASKGGDGGDGLVVVRWPVANEAA